MSPLISEDTQVRETQTNVTNVTNVPVTSNNSENVADEKSSSLRRHEHRGTVQDLSTKRCAENYIFWRVLGEGSFSTVFLASDVSLGEEYAIKVCEKRLILKERKGEYVKREKDVLNLLNINQCTTAPFFVKLYNTFQDADRLYFVLSLAKNGELLQYISNGLVFNEKCSQFYAAEILRALEHLHDIGIIHRDLKPENILLDSNMHIVLTDFGSAKIIKFEPVDQKGEELPTAHRSRGASFVGTAQYVSPELLNESSVSYASDLWALGCVIYQMIAGSPPFVAGSDHEIFQKIRKLEFNFPESFNPKARDLVQKLLVLDVSSRLGTSDVGFYTSIRSHEFFAEVNFEHIYLELPPLKPFISYEESKNFSCSDSVPSSVYPGLDSKQLSRLLGLCLYDQVPSDSRRKLSISEILKSSKSIQENLLLQQQHNEWHSLVQGKLILKYGLVHKRKGLLMRKRVLILTTGPHLFYADPASKTLKGEIPWSQELREEAKNFRIFYIHTPDRTFRWEDPEGTAPTWCEAIEQVRLHIYGLT